MAARYAGSEVKNPADTMSDNVVKDIVRGEKALVTAAIRGVPNPGRVGVAPLAVIETCTISAKGMALLVV